MLDDVYVDETNLYVDYITEITDNTEKLLKRINDAETEHKKLKSENMQLKNENMQLKNDKKNLLVRNNY